MGRVRSGKGRRAAGHDAADSTKTVTGLVIILVLLIAFLPTTIVVAVGMVPTVVAYIVDVTPGRFACRCVAGLNIAGVSPFLSQLWSRNDNLAEAFQIVTDPFAWLSFYGASAIGWMLFLGVPNAVATVQTLNSKRLASLHRGTQKRLVEEWGDSIQSDASSFSLSGPSAGSSPADDDD